MNFTGNTECFVLNICYSCDQTIEHYQLHQRKVTYKHSSTLYLLLSVLHECESNEDRRRDALK